MPKVILDVASREAVSRRFRNALAGKTQGTRLSFDTPALLIKVLSGRRWNLLQVMTGAGPMTIGSSSRTMQSTWTSRCGRRENGDFPRACCAIHCTKCDKNEKRPPTEIGSPWFSWWS